MRSAFDKASALASVGVIVEFYDWLLFGLLAPILSHVFFPHSDRIVSLLLVWATFAVGMFMRPFGGMFFGWFGSRYGRKRALTLTVLLMSIPMILTAILPSYETWGLAAPIMVVALRMIQGFSVGGEYAGTVVYLSETAPADRRGMVVNTANGASGLGALVAAVVVLILVAVMSPAQESDWGWRIAYAVGGLIVLLALFMQRHLPETESFEREKAAGHLSRRPLRDALRFQRREIIIAMVMVGYAQITFYFVLTYLPTFFKAMGNQTQEEAVALTMALSAVFAFSAPWWGLASDRFGRRWTMGGAAIFVLLLAYPSFVALESTSNALVYLGAFALLLGTMAFWGGFSPAIAELFKARHVMAGVGMGYNIGTAIFGGTMGVAVTALVGATGNALGPAIYMMAGSAAVAIVVFRLRETARTRFEASPVEPESPPGQPTPADPSG